jgi:S1/P1 Nuclease
MNNLRSAWFYGVAIALVFSFFAVQPSFGWGNDGHRMVNRLAVSHLPQDFPAFMKTPQAIDEIEYLGPEPDRWRSPLEPELVSAQAPEHFIDLELADVIGPLPTKRFQFLAAAYAAQLTHPGMDLRPEHVGLQPWQTTEVYERLKTALREYRNAVAEKRDTKAIEQSAIFYAGWLGHYVADGAQPLHVTVNYDGWVNPQNPEGFTTEHGIHWKFESSFVSANIKAGDVEPRMTPLHTESDIFKDYLAYLRTSGTRIEKLYRLDKAKGFDDAGSAESRAFTADCLAAGASMLRDMIYTAWLESAKPLPPRETPATKPATKSE